MDEITGTIFEINLSSRGVDGFLRHNHARSVWIVYAKGGVRVDEIESEKTFKTIGEYMDWGADQLRKFEAEAKP